VIIALYGANLIANVYYDEFTGMLKPFVVGIVDSSLDDALGYMNVNEQENEALDGMKVDVELEDDEDVTVYSLSKSILKSLGIADDAAAELANEASEDNDKFGTDMSVDLTELLCDRISFVGVFTVALILISIIFMVVGNIFDLSFGIPGHENLNHISGAALGVIKGMLIVVAITCICRYTGLILPEKIISNTWLFEKLVNSNKLATIIGI
jgi:hypothetical protein